MKTHLRMKVAGSRLGWEGHIQGMSKERLTKRAWKTEVDGRWRRGRPTLRRRDRVRRDLKRAGVNGQEWERMEVDHKRWRQPVKRAEQTVAPTSQVTKGEIEEVVMETRTMK